MVERNFETGDDTDWDTKQDTDTSLPGGSGDDSHPALDFPHYTELARYPWSNWAPASGAYCMRVRLDGNDAAAYLLENDSNIALAANEFLKFDVNFSSDFTGSADDTFNLLELQSSGTVEAAVSARIVATTNVINLGIGELAATSWSALPIQRNTWYTVELDVTIDDTDAGTNTGTIDLYITKLGDPTATVISATQVGSANQVAITDAVLGVKNQLTTTTGDILFDNFIHDDARIYSRRDRFPRTVVLTRSGHAFVGPGKIENVTLLSGNGTNNVLRIFDTDRESAIDEANVVVELKNTVAFETVDPAGMPVDVHRGCYVDIAGTAPRAVVLIGRAGGYGSSAAIRNMGRAIKQIV